MAGACYVDHMPWSFSSRALAIRGFKSMWKSDQLVEFAVSPLGEMAISQKVVSLINTLWPPLHVLLPVLVVSMWGSDRLEARRVPLRIWRLPKEVL